MQTPKVHGQGTNRGSSGLLSSVRRTLMSVPSLGWDRGCVLGPWVSGKHSPWKRRTGEDQCWGGGGGGASEVGTRNFDALASLPFSLTPAEMGAEIP